MANKAASKKKHHKESVEEVREHLPMYFEKFIAWGTKNLKVIGIVIAVLILAIILGGAWYNYQEGQKQQALILEAEAMDLHETAQSERMANSPDAETEDEAKAENPYQEAIEKYQELIETFPNTESAARAEYMLGSIEYEMGNYEKAQEYFTTYTQKYAHKPFAAEAEMSLAYIAEQQGNYQEAIEKFKSVESKMTSTRKAEAQLAIGRNYETLQKIDDAVAMYKAIVDSNTAGSWKEQARERLEILQPEDLTAKMPAPQENAAAEESSPEEQPAETEGEQPAEANTEEQPEEQPAAEATEEPAVTEEQPEEQPAAKATEEPAAEAVSPESSEEQQPASETPAAETSSGN